MSRTKRAIAAYLKALGASAEKASDAAEEITQALERFTIDCHARFQAESASRSLTLNDLIRLRHGLAETLALVTSIEPQSAFAVAYAASAVQVGAGTSSPSLLSLQIELEFLIDALAAAIATRQAAIAPGAVRLFASCISARREAAPRETNRPGRSKDQSTFFGVLMKRLDTGIIGADRKLYREAFDQARRFVERGEFDGLRYIPLDFTEWR